MRIGLVAPALSPLAKQLQHNLTVLTGGPVDWFDAALPEGTRVSLGERGATWDGVSLDGFDALFIHGFRYEDPVLPVANRRRTGRCGRRDMSDSSSATVCSTACCRAWKRVDRASTMVHPSICRASRATTSWSGWVWPGYRWRPLSPPMIRMRPNGSARPKRRHRFPSSGGPWPAAVPGRYSATVSAST